MILDRHPSRPTERPNRPEIKLFLGYWYSEYHPQDDWLPHPQDFVDNTWDAAERALVAQHLRSGEVWESWRGSSSCRFCGLRNGYRCLTDGTFVWPEGFAHYLEAHGVKPPKEFINHVKSSPRSSEK